VAKATGNHGKREYRFRKTQPRIQVQKKPHTMFLSGPYHLSVSLEINKKKKFRVLTPGTQR
jgi:hypothetical protein